MTTKPVVCRMIWRIPSQRDPQPPPKPPPNKKRKNRGTNLPPSPPCLIQCSTCSEKFDKSHFISDRSKRAKPTKTCRTCRVDNRARVKKSRQNPTSKYHQQRQLFFKIKKFTLHNYKCQMCGERLCKFGAFEFDHIHPGTKIGCLSHFCLFKTRKDFLDEWAKCQALCTGCHEIKTRTDQQDRDDMPASMLGAL